MPNLWTRLVGGFFGTQHTTTPPQATPPAATTPPVTVKGPTDAQKALATDQVDSTARAKDVAPAKTMQQQAVAELRQIIAGGKLSYYLEAEQKTGKLIHPEAEKLFAALPVLTAATTAKQLHDVGLISKIPEGVEKMWAETPRYFVGRQILVSAPVETDTGAAFHTYKEGGETRATHRAYIVGEQGNNFQVMVEGREKPLTVPKPNVYKLNEGHTVDGERGKAWGVDIDYKNDVILKAKIAAAMIQLDDLIGKLDFRTVDKAVTQKALAEVAKPAEGSPAFSGAGKMVDVSSWSQDGVGELSSGLHASLRSLFTALGGKVDEVGPSVQRVLNSLIGKDGAAQDLGKLDWPAFAQEMQTAVAKDNTLALQREALSTLHKQIYMQHPASVYGSGFGTNYRPPAGGNGEAGKMANGGIGVCNLQASVLFALLQPFKHVLGYETQLEMGCCISPRAGRNGQVDKNPPHGWVIASMWPSGERFVSDRTWHHPCLALDYAFSPSGDRRHVTWDPNVRQNTVVTSKDIDMSGTFHGAKPQPVADKATHGRPSH